MIETEGDPQCNTMRRTRSPTFLHAISKRFELLSEQFAAMPQKWKRSAESAGRVYGL